MKEIEQQLFERAKEEYRRSPNYKPNVVYRNGVYIYVP